MQNISAIFLTPYYVSVCVCVCRRDYSKRYTFSAVVDMSKEKCGVLYTPITDKTQQLGVSADFEAFDAYIYDAKL